MLQTRKDPFRDVSRPLTVGATHFRVYVVRLSSNHGKTRLVVCSFRAGGSPRSPAVLSSPRAAPSPTRIPRQFRDLEVRSASPPFLKRRKIQNFGDCIKVTFLFQAGHRPRYVSLRKCYLECPWKSRELRPLVPRPAPTGVAWCRGSREVLPDPREA